MAKFLSSFPLTERTYRYTASSKYDADIYRMCSGSDSSTRRKPRPVYFCSIAVPNPREHSCRSDQPAKQRMGVSMRSNSIKRICEYWIQQKCIQTMLFFGGVMIVLLYRIFYGNKFSTTEDRSEQAKDRETFTSRQIKGHFLSGLLHELRKMVEQFRPELQQCISNLGNLYQLLSDLSHPLFLLTGLKQ